MSNQETNHTDIMRAIGHLEGQVSSVVSQQVVIIRNTERNAEVIGNLEKKLAKTDQEVGEMQAKFQFLKWLIGIALAAGGVTVAWLNSRGL